MRELEQCRKWQLLNGQKELARVRRMLRRVRKGMKESDPSVMLDAIGQPRGVPEEFKTRSEIAASFDSILVYNK